MITYLVGDATDPQGEGHKVIAHCCNTWGLWGQGFVNAISKRWSAPELRYRLWHKQGAGGGFVLGATQFVLVDPLIVVANILGQDGVGVRHGVAPIRYDALGFSFVTVANHASATGASVHMPRIGCGLAGGTWDRVEPLVQETLVARGVPVFVYDLPKSSGRK